MAAVIDFMKCFVATKTASDAEIKKAYCNLQKYHPDSNPNQIHSIRSVRVLQNKNVPCVCSFIFRIVVSYHHKQASAKKQRKNWGR